ncbi:MULTISPECIES: hypothetical protein [unclassified Mesorhizobium]|uniref:hypothetical protein n=1 Tax=unclassified Mesorhizobium TaxID=325217 RepID=UPI000FD6D685|nr:MULTISPECIES: hypothetical protein [unclassified Mesorhizobium]TGQ34991.1 hypothetical protein EN859_024015 [Mesorhizobium sp. M00.F.Ca.ET.216.01.1.1]TIS54868.1 MAG: hypothetical protein E5W91_25030 [Mesorhizobium sp.]TIS86566.1 MAG: hypothetical protein E5W89_28700 [Mesorhizobium sp.]TJW09152.1 MAG: hypothetical protein E5W82_22210 [Mesorhizobium sp.]TJW45260.1 MAG: hypothetical protein E5W83_12215 [Mesorhizobium sp.]
MSHSIAVLFTHFGNWLRLIRAKDRQLPENETGSPTPVRLDAERNRLPPRDESFYWAWQYWSQ